MNTKKRLLALGLAFALIFNMVDVTTAAATAPEVTQTEEEQHIEEQTEEQKQEPAGDSLEEREIEALESNTGITNVDTGLEDSEKKDSESDAAVAAVQEMINALPDVDTLDDMESDELEKAYADTQAAYEAYEALTEEQQSQLTGADCFEALLDWFTGQVALLADETAANVAEVTVDGTTTQYTDIGKAFEAAQNSDGSTVRLLSNVTTTSQIVVDSGTFTLDLNGNKLYRDSGNTLRVNGGSVTVTSSQDTGTISNGGNNAIYVESGATVHVTKGVQLNRLYAYEDANLTLDAGVIITGKFFTAAENIAPFLTGKALQRCDADGKPTDGQYVSIYQNYDETDTGCVIVIEHKSCDGTPSQGNPCKICGYDGTQTKPTEPADLNVAEVNGTKYKTLAEAITAANGADITLLKIFGENVVVDDASSKAGIILGNGGTIEGEGTYSSNWMAMQGDTSPCIPLTMTGGEITLKEGVLAQNGVGGNARAAIALKGGTLIVESTVTEIAGGKVAGNVRQCAIEATGGMLDLQGNTLLDGGLSISADAQLQSKLTAGIFTNIGDGAARVSVEGDKYNTVFDLLATGYAFAKYENGATSEVIVKDDSTKKLTEDVAVIACTHKGADNKSLFKDGKCKACGFTCAHSKNNVNQFKDGVCTVCGYVCPHTNVDPQTATCTYCGADMAVKVTKDDTTTYYAEHHEAGYPNGEDTLKQVFNNAESGSTITLLADGLYASAWATGKTITLDLNGKKLIENNGILAAKDDSNGVLGKLIVTGSGSSTTPADSFYTCTFRVIDGCALLFDDGFSGSYGTIYVQDGTLTSDSTNMTIGTLDIQNSGVTVSLKGGTFGKICFSSGWGNVKAGALLALDNYGQISGKAFKYTAEDGAFVPYNTEITSSGVENVTIVDCPHDSINDGGTCAYCGMTGITAVLTKPDGSIVTYAMGSGYDIFTGWASNGGTLKLYSDLTYSGILGTQDGTTEMVIDLNGHKVTLPTGAENQEVAVNGGTLTITDSGSGKTGKFASPLSVYYAANLIVDGAAVGNITVRSKSAKVLLKEGTTFTAIDVSSVKCLIAEFIPAGCYIVDDSNNAVDLVQTSITSDAGFTVKPIPGTVTVKQKIDNISYGSNVIADELLPEVTMNDGSTPQLTYEWYRNTDSGAKKLITITKSEDSTVRNMESGAWNNLSVGDKLDVFCIISAETAGTPWKTPVTGYTLTVTAGDLAEASIDLTGSNNPVYTPDGSGSCYQQTLDFRASHNGMGLTEGTDYQITDDSNHGYNAGNYTLVLEGLGKYAGSTLEYEWVIAPRTLTGIGTLALTKGYDGKTSLTVDTIPFIYGDNQTISLECTGSEAACEVTGDYDDANAGGGKTATLTVKLKNSNYIFANDSKEETFTVTNASITKAAAPKLTDLSHFQKYTVTTAQTASLERAGMPADAGTLTYTAGQAATTGSVHLSSWNVNESGEVTYTLTGGEIGDTVTMPVTISSLNYESTVVNVIITLTDKESPVVTANPVTVTYDGKSVSENKITGTATCNGKTVEGTWSWKDGQELTNASASGEKTVIFTPADQVNYTTAETKLQLTINKKEVSITDTVIAGTKEYDGTTTAAITDNGKLNGICAGDDLAITAGKAEYTDKNAGKDKTVSFTGFTLTGTDANNYMLSGQPVSVKADITAKEVTLTGKISAENRTYESGNTSVALKGTDLKLGGLVGNETLTVSVQNGTVADADAGEKKAVTYLPTLTDGANGGKAENYVLSKTLPSVTVDIRKAAGSMVAPAALEKLVYNGSEQTLIMAGSSKTGEMQYRLGENGVYSTALPTAKDAGTYAVYYRVVGDKNHEDVAESSMQVTIATQPSSGSHTGNTTESQPTESQPAQSQPAVSTPETASAPIQQKTGSSHVNVPEADGIGATEQTKAQEPYVSGDAGKSGWNQIKNEIGAAIREVQTQNQQTEDSEPVTVTVNMNGTTVVPGEIFDSIKGQNISVTFDMGDGITWTVNGMDITADQINDIDFGVSMGAEAGQRIPVDIINNVTGERYSMNLTLNYEGTFGFKAILTVNVEKTNAGLFANLFYYNQKSGELEFICADEIRADGSVDLTFTHASDYVVVVDKEPMDGTAADETVGTEEPAEETMTDAVVQEPDSGQMNWLILLIIIALLAGAGAVLVWKSKEKKKEE